MPYGRTSCPASQEVMRFCNHSQQQIRCVSTVDLMDLSRSCKHDDNYLRSRKMRTRWLIEGTRFVTVIKGKEKKVLNCCSVSTSRGRFLCLDPGSGFKRSSNFTAGEKIWSLCWLYFLVQVDAGYARKIAYTVKVQPPPNFVGFGQRFFEKAPDMRYC